MASAAEIANDLRALAAMPRTLVSDALSMNRAAAMIDALQKTIAEMDLAAETEAQKYEDHFYGVDV